MRFILLWQLLYLSIAMGLNGQSSLKHMYLAQGVGTQTALAGILALITLHLSPCPLLSHTIFVNSWWFDFEIPTFQFVPCLAFKIDVLLYIFADDYCHIIISFHFLFDVGCMQLSRIQANCLGLFLRINILNWIELIYSLHVFEIQDK